jgi:hypothetical protein
MHEDVKVLFSHRSHLKSERFQGPMIRVPSVMCMFTNDSKAMPYVVLTCAECLRAFPMNLLEGTTGRVLEIVCRSCHGMNRYIIEPSNHCALEASV